MYPAVQCTRSALCWVKIVSGIRLFHPHIASCVAHLSRNSVDSCVYNSAGWISPVTPIWPDFRTTFSGPWLTTMTSRQGVGCNCPHPLNFGLSENVLPKVQNLGLEIPCFTEIEFLSTHNLLSRKFAAVCRENTTSCPFPTFSNPRRRLCVEKFALLTQWNVVV